MSNVLSEEKKQQVLALGRLGWTFRKIQRATGVRRETIGAYLRAEGIAHRPPRGRTLPRKPASGVSTDPRSQAKGAKGESPCAPCSSGPSASASACEPYRDEIEEAVRVGRNATAIYQDLVDPALAGFVGKTRWPFSLLDGLLGQKCG